MKKEVEINKFNPCKEAYLFRLNYPDFEAAWDNCPRGDWMLWIAKRLNVDLMKFVLAKALCANTVRHLMKNERSIKAVDVAIAFGNGLATREELDAAYVAAYVAATYAYAAYAASAAAAAAYAADAAYAAYAADADAAADAADAAAYAAYADAYTAAYTAADAARTKNRKETADICRQILTEDVFKLIKQI